MLWAGQFCDNRPVYIFLFLLLKSVLLPVYFEFYLHKQLTAAVLVIS